MVGTFDEVLRRSRQRMAGRRNLLRYPGKSFSRHDPIIARPSRIAIYLTFITARSSYAEFFGAKILEGEVAF